MQFWIDNHGCAKNQVDAEEIAARLSDDGHILVDTAIDADLIIVNTCGFIESAKRESIDAVVALKRRYPAKKVLVAGCLSQRYPSELAAELLEADGVAGNADLADIVRAAEGTLAGARPVVHTSPPATASASGAAGDRPATASYRRKRLYDFPGTAHVKITEGCSNHCSFCAIPIIRGDLRSRDLEDILGECLRLVHAGIRELVLIGQDLGSYGLDISGNRMLPDLLRSLAEIPVAPGGSGEFRVRVMYIHPDNFPDGIVGIMRSAGDRIIPYFDLPFQHASARILHSMNRRGDADRYLGIVDSIRSGLPESMIRSTFLVGFPGESEEDFDLLMRFQQEARLDWAGVFQYSREEGTTAWNLKPRVSAKTAKQRKRMLEETQTAVTSTRLARFVGSVVDVLVEERMEDGEHSIGRGWMQAPDVDGLTLLHGSFEPGTMIRARIDAVNGVDFEAHMVD